MSGSVDNSVYVLGAGIIGLTTACILQQRGFDVTIGASAFTPGTTSDVAAAVWYPYAVSPRHRALEWSRESFRRFKLEADRVPELVRMVEFHELFTTEVESPWWGSAVDSFRHVDADKLPSGYVSGFAAMVPVIESGSYLKYLLDRLQAAGAKIQHFESPVESFQSLGIPLVVNCTGLGSQRLCDDNEMYPIRGQVIRIDGVQVERTYADDEYEMMPTYIVPRTTDCILGGTATRGDDDLGVRDTDTQSILSRCARIVPGIDKARIREVKVGLRPGRSSVRIDSETTDWGRIVHNYGHGGAGYTLCWGCAENAANLAADRR